MVDGLAICRERSASIDELLRGLLASACESGQDGVALVAVGGYGRGELCPHSDVDIVLLHRRRPDISAVADRLWYPLWDNGLKLGHSVATVPEALELSSGDLATATAQLSSRHVAGDRDLTQQLAVGSQKQWQRRWRHWFPQLLTSIRERHDTAGEVAFRLEPELKEGRGGLRDVHALHWVEAAHRVILDYDRAGLDRAYATLLAVRVELQRRSGRPASLLVQEEQEEVARGLGLRGRDELRSLIAEAARLISWTSDDAWRRLTSSSGGGRSPFSRAARQRRLEPGIVLRGDEVEVDDVAAVGDEPLLPLRVAVAALRNGAAIERHTLELLTAAPALPSDAWPAEARELFVELLLGAHRAIGIIEALDQRQVWTKVLPEWQGVRARVQHNAYHRFTVDRHLLETAANAAGRASQVGRPDLLVLAALLHDIGKGTGRDHSVEGAALAETIVRRMGFPAADVATVRETVRLHLLLAEVATRRDIEEPATLDSVASTVGTLEVLELLTVVTEVDALATGAAAWSPWKAQLVGQLAQRVRQILEDGAAAATMVQPFPRAEQLQQLSAPGRRIEAASDRLTIMTDDRPGIFSRTAGVLTLHGLDVLSAKAHSTDAGRALAEFRVSDPRRDETPWPRVIEDLERALDGRLAVNARLSERVRTYGRGRTPGGSGSPSVAARVSFDNEASASATVIDIEARDSIGILYRITRALAELDLDIRSARIETLGGHVADSFYVHDRAGQKVTDPGDLAEIERAIVHSLDGIDG